jgi:hypothetical protein
MVWLYQILRHRVHNSRGIGRGRIITTATTTMLLLTLVSTQAHAQRPLAGLITDLFDRSTINAPSTATGVPIQHQGHFIVGENLKLTTREVNLAIASQVATFPIPSSSGGFTFNVNDRGEVTPTSTNFGPLFAERAVTIGRKQFNVGFSFQSTGFSSFEGVDLDSGQLSFIREHNDCCPAGANNPPTATNFTPEFERDLLRSNLRATIDTNTTAFFANYGLTDRFDVGLAVPIVHVKIDASVDSQILRMAAQSVNNPLIHSFDGLGSSTETLSASGSASGLGDVLLRAKYNFARTQTTAFAAALDLRLPTGDKDNLLGSGATQTKLFFVGSGEYGRFNPHVNFGYTFSSGDASEEAVTFDLDPSQYALATLGGFTPNTVDLSVPDEVNYVFGLSFAPTSRVTVGFDVHGRTMRDVARFSLQDNSYINRTTGPAPTAPYVAQNEFSVENSSGNLNLLLGVVGGKINLGGAFLLNVTVLFQMNDDGLKAKPTPVIGFDYVF